MNTALLLIDIQNDYFETGAMPLVGAEQAGLQAKQVLSFFRTKQLPIIHIQHIATRPNASFFIPNTKGVEIHPSVSPLANEKVIVKHFPNSFRETDLQQYLTANQIRNLVVCGMMTHMCIDASVRAAKDLGYTITLLADACATRNLEIENRKVAASEVQTAFLAALSYYYATISSVEQFCKDK